MDWSVAVGEELYVRACYGQDSGWYQAAVRQKAGRITVAGTTKEVSFEPVDGPIKDLVDDAYEANYRGSPYLAPMISKRARSATVKVTPRGSNSVIAGRDTLRRILSALALAMALSHAARGAKNATTKRTDSMKIRLKVEDRANGYFHR